MQGVKKNTKQRQITHCESHSLWNYTLSPGWTDGEVTILKKALQRFGIGKWKKIIESRCLPGKSIGQIYMQTQRLLGQQSLGEFMGLQVDLEKIFQENMKKTGLKRKNNCIINEGDNPTKEERKKKIEENLAKFGLSPEFVKTIKLPRPRNGPFTEIFSLEEIESDKFATLEKIIHLESLKKVIEKRLSTETEVPQDEVVINLQKVNASNFKLVNPKK